MSWFNMDTLSNLQKKVQNAIPVDKEMIAKLTLTTPELSAERQRLEEDERRKERVKDSLAGMLPWETKDNEREILVEECKEAIMALSGKIDTFFGPYEMPAMPNLKEKKRDEEEEEEDEEEDEEEESEHKDRKPSKESLEQLEKLEPLPSLLGEFDLDSHVGLIQRLLKEDSRLVEMQSNLSGGGERERTFWRNYFFHCAFTRYEAGLSIDEIWSEDSAPSQRETAAEDKTHEETVTFDPKAEEKPPVEQASFPLSAEKETADETDPNKETDFSKVAGDVVANPDAEFEMVGGADEGVGGDDELDELEAEIARELQD